MSDTKTGNKGFVVDGEVYHIDQVPVGDDGVNIPANLKPLDPGSIKVDNTIKDIGKKTRITLGTYLSKATKGEVGSATVSNKYPIDAPTADSLTSKIVEGGYPAPISPTTNSSVFAGNLPSSFSEDYSALQGGADDTLKIKKGLSSKEMKDGNDLLPGVSVDPAITTVVSKYQTYSFFPNYRSPGTKFTAEDILSPSSGFDPKKVNYTSLTLKKPSEEAVNASDLSSDLESVVRTPQTLTTKNVYPVTLPALNVKIIPVSTTTEGYPSPLTTPSNQNSSVFAGNLPSSVSDNYIKASNTVGSGDNAVTTIVGKGKSQESSTKNILDGNELLPGVGKDALQPALAAYTDAATSPNYRTSFVSFSDFKTPPKSLDVPLVDLPNNYFKEPNEESVVSGQLTLNLKKAVQKVASLTAGTDSESPGLKNAYPVSISDKFDASTDLASISSVDGYPSPLTTPTNENLSIFAGNLPSSFSEDYSALQKNGPGFKKGKSPLSLLDGNDLLSNKGVTKLPNGVVQLGDSLLEYTKIVLDNNTFNPEIRGKLQSNTFLDSSVNISSPPGTFEPTIEDIDPTEQNGLYTGAKKNPVTLKELRQKAIDVTSDNEYRLDKTLDQLSSTADQSTGLPSPLTSTNTTSYVSSDQIKPSKDPSIENFSIGKESKGQGKINGNTLLRFGVSGNRDVTGDGSRTKEGLPVGSSETGIAESNPLYNYKGGRGTPVLSVGQNRWTAASRRFIPSADGQTKLVLPDGTEVDQLKMANVGAGLMLRASGEIPAWYADKFNPNDSESSAGAILPSVVQAGVLKVNNLKLTALDVFNHLKDDATFNPDSLTSIAPFDGQSWGSTNNPEEMFDDTSGIGSSITMLTMIIAISGLFTLIGNANNGAGRQTKTLGGQMSLGKYKFPPDSSEKVLSYFNADEILGLYATNNNFEDSLAAGAKAFFLGASNADISFGEVALAVTGIGLDSIVGDASAVGANLTVCRTIVRSGLMIAQQTETIIKRFKSNPVSGAKALTGVFKILRSSKIMRAMNTFASLGDALLDRKNGSIVIPGPDGRPIEINKNGFESVDPSLFSGDNSTVNGLQQTHTKSRLTYKDKYDSSLAWGAARAPAMYLTDSAIEGLSLLDFDGNLGSFKGALGLKYKTAGGNSQPSYHQPGENGRISNVDKDRMERILDSEYVPFYFHDVRTNEIVSFHAFLASISDDYSVNYESSEGIGRIEPVKIYKGTTRKIGLSFYIAATSEDDFDHMWFKINKLTTLIYPQYTRGRDLLPSDDANQYRFTAPFSQIPGASPLIRIRLGDLFRSNYSKFALARLFGAGRKASRNNQMSLPGSSGKPTTIDTSTYSLQSLQDWLAVLPKDTELDVDQIKNYLNKVNPKIKTTDVKSVKVVDSTDKGQTYTIAYTHTTPDVNLKDVTVPGIPSNVVYPTQEEINKKLNQINTESDGAARGALTDFLKSEKNAIVKSFESAGGKGLAGVIESMNFDWYDKVTWETNPGQTAPKLCKVTISFSPIHDISPGIDHAGYNRAPIYPVGRGMAPSKIKF